MPKPHMNIKQYHDAMHPILEQNVKKLRDFDALHRILVYEHMNPMQCIASGWLPLESDAVHRLLEEVLWWRIKRL